MEKNTINTIEVKKFNGAINVSKDILDTFNIASELIFWQKDEKEMILFSEKKRNIFFSEMKKASGFSPSQLEWTKEGQSFLRWLCSRGTNVQINNSGKIIFPRTSCLRKDLNGTDFNVKCYI